MPDYTHIQNLLSQSLLKRNLSTSAVRRGTSAFRFGLVPEGISDHLPIQIEIKSKEQASINMISWNLLSDKHLYNNFMNITGTSDLLSRLTAKNSYGGEENQNKLYHYFSELAQFLYDKHRQGQIIVITSEVLKEFGSLKQQPSRLALSRKPAQQIEKAKGVEASRTEIMDVLLDPNDEKAPEFKLAVRHSIELIHHIKAEVGALKWDNRYKQLQANQALLANLNANDFICLQECTDPHDLQRLLPGKQGLIYATDDDFQDADNHTTFTQSIENMDTNKCSRDHCVIFYDDAKFELIKMDKNPLRYALHGTKPCLAARFRNKENGGEFIVGSVHHPGGKVNCLDEISEAICVLKHSDEKSIPFYLAGDYNHTEDVFSNVAGASYQLSYPDLRYGTMAGSDYNNTNRSIDAVLTHASDQHVNVSRLDCIPESRPAETPITIQFRQKENYMPQVLPSILPPVGNFVSKKSGLKAIKALGENNADYAPRITL